MTVAKASYQALLDTASKAGCVGIEIRNDLTGRLFDGIDPSLAGQMARDQGLRILALAEVKAFNHFSEDVMENVEALVSVATACGAEGISLIPANDGSGLDSSNRYRHLKQALAEIKPVLESNNLTGFVEPLGFESASLRYKHELVDVITELDAAGRFKIVHDTFHHYLVANDPELKNSMAGTATSASLLSKTNAFFAEHTGIVHISGVTDQRVSVRNMADSHRVLVDATDRLHNVQQLNSLVSAGYTGAVSVEAFSPTVHQYSDPVAKLTESFNYIKAEFNADAA